MSLNTLVLLTNGGTILLFLAIVWLVLSFVLLKIIFFPSKKYLQRKEKKKTLPRDLNNAHPEENVQDLKADSTLDEAEIPENTAEDTKPIEENSETAAATSEDEAFTTAISQDRIDKTPENKLQSLTHLLKDFTPPESLRRAKKSSSFWTYIAKDSDALEVGTAFADELQRLGYEIESDTHETASATHEDVTLALHIKQKKKNVKIDVKLQEL